MPSREFPAPPDLSELLKFFESDEGKARVNRQNEASRLANQKRRQQTSLSKRSSPGNLRSTSSTVREEGPEVKSAASRRLSQPSTTNSKTKSARDDRASSAFQGWNASTLPPAPANSLRHQLLCRTYQPPAPMYVVPSEASELLDRLAKGTISSRSKLKAPSDPSRDNESCSVKKNDGKSSTGASLADTRAQDAIQTLLFYRKEVESRRRLDTNDSRHTE